MRTAKRRTFSWLVVLSFIGVLSHAGLPPLVEVQQLAASDGIVGDVFGSAVELSGNDAFVGEDQDGEGGQGAGAVYVFGRQANGSWVEKQKLLPADTTSTQHFGISIAADGQTLLIGARSDNEIGTGEGAAYVFLRGADGLWAQQQKLLASDGAGGAQDHFGNVVAIDGNTALVATDGGNPRRVFVFERDAAGDWIEVQKLLSPDSSLSWFGRAIALDGDTAVVTSAFPDAGGAWVYTRDATGVWSEQQALVPSGGAAGARFGRSVALDGNWMVIGADGDNSEAGAVYTFHRDGGGLWGEHQKLTASDAASEKWFGFSVALEGNVGILGSPDKGFGPPGATYAFVRDPSNDVWSESQQLNASDGFPGDRFGFAVSLDGETVVTGAPALFVGDPEEPGYAYVFATEAPDVPATRGCLGIAALMLLLTTSRLQRP